MHWVSNIDQHPYNMTLDGQGSEAEVSKVMNEISKGVEVDEETAGELDAAAMTLLASAGLTPREMVSWAAVPTKVALNNMSAPNLSKQAIDLFKMVCACMGEDGKGGVVAEPKVKREMMK